MFATTARDNAQFFTNNIETTDIKTERNVYKYETHNNLLTNAKLKYDNFTSATSRPSTSTNFVEKQNMTPI